MALPLEQHANEMTFEYPLMRDDITNVGGKRVRVRGVDPGRQPPLAGCLVI